MSDLLYSVADVPDSLVEVVQVIGLQATLKLVEKWGGIRVYVPRPESIGPEHALAAAIGLEAARRFAAVWGVNPEKRPAFPRCVDLIRRARNRALRADFQQLTAPEVALKYQMTERQVYAINAQPDDPIVAAGPSPQLGLF